MPNDVMFGIAAEQLSAGVPVTVSVLGRSMRPFYKSGSTITLLPIDDNAIKWGNVVLAKIRENQYAVHRIIGINGNTITLMGDGNPRGTEIVERSEIFGYIEWGGFRLLLAKIWYAIRPVRWILLGIDRRIFK